MIRVTPAVFTESRDRDKPRGRLLLKMGEKSWHLSRREAEELVRSVTEALGRLDAPDQFTGILRKEGWNSFFLEMKLFLRLYPMMYNRPP